MTSNAASRNSASSRRSSRSSAALAAALLVLAGSAAAAWIHARGWTLYYGDAEAHLNIARRLADSRVEGVHQIGTVWLPLPHLLMAPLAARDDWWRSGLAGIPVSVAAYAAAGLFLFLALRRLTGSPAAAAAGTAVFALNPNLLYLQATPMTEPLALACLLGLLYFLTRFSETRSALDAALAGLAGCAGSLTRYEIWFLLPFAALFVLWRGGARRWRSALLFPLIAAAGPLWWLAHNAYFYSDPLEFWRGEWSARAIYARQLAHGMAPYPGDHDWKRAAQYYLEAAKLCTGAPLFWLSMGGAAVALRRHAAALAFLLLAPVFYVMSMHSSGTPIFVPHLWPFSYYNTRYGMAWLAVAAMGVAVLAALAPKRWQPAAAAALVAASLAPWLMRPGAGGVDLLERIRSQLGVAAAVDGRCSCLSGGTVPSGRGHSAELRRHHRRAAAGGHSGARVAPRRRSDGLRGGAGAAGPVPVGGVGSVCAGRPGLAHHDATQARRAPLRMCQNLCRKRLARRGDLAAHSGGAMIPFTKAHGARNDFLLTWAHEAPPKPCCRQRRGPSATAAPAWAPMGGCW